MQYGRELYLGAASYYRRYRERYDPVYVELLSRRLGLDGTGRLLDVGCGTGFVVLPLAERFAEAVGLDPDPDMLEEAAAEADELGVANVRWNRGRAEDISELGLGSFRLITMAQAFHWMDRERVVELLYEHCEPGGAVAIVDHVKNSGDDEAPWEELKDVIREYLGPRRRAGNSVYRDPGPPELPFVHSKFQPIERHRLPSVGRRVRSADDVMGFLYSLSYAARPLFGDGVEEFDVQARALLARHSPSGEFWYTAPEVEVLLFQK